MTLLLIGPNDLPVGQNYTEMLCDADLCTTFDAALAARQSVFVEDFRRWIVTDHIYLPKDES